MHLRSILMAAATVCLTVEAAGARQMTPEPWTAEQSETADLPAARRGDVDAQMSLARIYEARPPGDPKRALAVDFWAAAAVSGRPQPLDALLRHARAGDVRAQVFLGRALMVRDTGADRAAGLDWLRRAADAGSVDAGVLLGCLLGASPNRAERAEAMVRLDRAGRADPSVAALTRLLSEQIGPRNVRPAWRLVPAARLRPEAAFDWSAEAQRRSVEHWGLPRMSGDIAADLSGARAAGRLFELAEAAYAGDPAAGILLHWEIGRRCDNGKVLARSACAAYQQAWPRNLSPPLSNAFSGSRPVAHMLDAGRMFELGIGGPKDPKTARAFYDQLGWASGGPDAAEAIWRLYLMEIAPGAGGDARRAASYLSSAENAGHPMASYVRGLEEEAKGDFAAAAFRYRAAADGGIADAAYRYAEMLATQKVIVRDGPAHIYKYFRKAALAGDIRGFDGVARAYWNGWGVPADPAQAEEWYQRGARAGDPRAAWAAGNLAGRRGDWPGSIPWYKLAARGGYPGAKEKVDRLAADGWRERSLGGFFMSMLDYAGALAQGAEQARQYQIDVQNEQIRQSIMICQACSAGSASGSSSAPTSSGGYAASSDGAGSSGASEAAGGSGWSGESGSSDAGSGSGGPGGRASGGGHMWAEPAEGSGSAWSAGGGAAQGQSGTDSGGASGGGASGGGQATGAIIVSDGAEERARIAQREADMQAEANRLQGLRDAENLRMRAQADADDAAAAARAKAAHERYAIACYGSLEAEQRATVTCE